MLPPERRSLTILHKISRSQRCLPGALALAVVLATVPSIEEASAAMGFGRQGSHSFGGHARGTFNTPRTINTRKSFHQTPITRSTASSKPGKRVVTDRGRGKGVGGKVVDGGRRPDGVNAIRAGLVIRVRRSIQWWLGFRLSLA